MPMLCRRNYTYSSPKYIILCAIVFSICTDRCLYNFAWGLHYKGTKGGGGLWVCLARSHKTTKHNIDCVCLPIHSNREIDWSNDRKCVCTIEQRWHFKRNTWSSHFSSVHSKPYRYIRESSLQLYIWVLLLWKCRLKVHACSAPHKIVILSTPCNDVFDIKWCFIVQHRLNFYWYAVFFRIFLYV